MKALRREGWVGYGGESNRHGAAQGQNRDSRFVFLSISMLVLFTSVSPNAVESIGTRISKLGGVFIGVGGGNGGGFWMDRQTSNAGIAFAVTALAGLALAAAVFYTTR
ncbi:hypothetical protein HAX54_016014 [Datura stramonium]|uniref:Protein-export membrane protein SecG n=1 Tax=Datura stramonium TaxID=4076 RepID=A0ABS8S070_DATST|nr:hypothetical protein [Datura stramonium]